MVFNMKKNIPIKEKIVLITVTLFSVAILFFIVKNRLLHPNITIQNNAQNIHFQASSNVIARDTDEIGALMQILATNPKDSVVLLKLTDLLMKKERWEAAENFAKQARDIAPKDYEPHYLLGIILHQQNKPTEAAKSLENALSIRDSAAARYSIAVLCLYYLNQEQKGIDHLQKALKLEDVEPGLRKAIEEELKRHTKNNP